jgi:glyoxylase-like metal-dependent hydrolase (beta-lactamase superfamily II)
MIEFARDAYSETLNRLQALVERTDTVVPGHDGSCPGC